MEGEWEEGRKNNLCRRIQKNPRRHCQNRLAAELWAPQAQSPIAGIKEWAPKKSEGRKGEREDGKLGLGTPPISATWLRPWYML